MIDPETGEVIPSVFKEMNLDEISAVDRPAQPSAKMSIMKRDQEDEEEEALEPEDEGVEKAQVEDGTPEPTEASKSTSGDITADHVGDVHNEEIMTQKNDQTAEQEVAVAKQLEELQVRAERAEKVAELSDAQKGIFRSLDVEKQDEFLALSPEQREAEVAKAAEANAVVETIDGVEYRKNDDPRLLMLAKAAKEEREKREKAEEEAKQADLRKRAEDLEFLPGSVEGRMAVLKAVDSLPEGERSEALETLKAQNSELQSAFQRVGTSQSTSEVNALDAIAKKFREADVTLTPEQAMAKALETPEGEAAYLKSLGH